MYIFLNVFIQIPTSGLKKNIDLTPTLIFRVMIMSDSVLYGKAPKHYNPVQIAL